MDLEGIHFSGNKEINIQTLFSNVANSFTYEFWVKPQAKIKVPFETTSLIQGHYGQNWVVGAGYGGTNSIYAGVGVSIGRNGIAVFEHGNNYFPATLVFRTLIKGWTHIAIVVKEKIPNLYINGRLTKQGLMSSKEKVFPSGILGGLDPYGQFFGEIDQLRIWNYVRSDNEIFSEMNKELSGKEPGLLVNIVKKNGDIIKKGKIFTSTPKLSFPMTKNPLVSIIIPVFNKWNHTYSCLQSIYKNTKEIDYEVIIADDLSTDRTKEIDKYFSNITLIRDGTNKGFLKNCNLAASYAKGKYLLFLNNDTEVQKDWLQHLVELMESDSKNGMVGAKLIHPNGKLQEAGSIIFNDGSCLGYGRGNHPDCPEYSYVREVHYCSGACMLVNRALFQEAGMFDEQFQPAYYEEVDLAMKIRELGYKVMYQPAAQVVHHEFGSSQINKVIELQIKNRAKFYEKWKRILQDFPPPNFEKVDYFCQMNSHNNLRILVVDDRIPVLELGSGFPRTFSILHALSELGYQVTFFPLQQSEKIEPYTTKLQQKGIEVIYHSKQTKMNFYHFYNKRKELYDITWISRPHNMDEIYKMIHSINDQQKIIYDVEALYSHREILKLGLAGEELSEETKEEMITQEFNLINKSDLIITVSEPEREWISKYSNKPILVAGHSIELNATRAPFSQRKDILFVGGFLTSPCPNEDAIHYFVKEIFPLINQKIGAKLWIVGTNHIQTIQQLASDDIIVTGRVDNLYEYYNKSKVFVIPTRYAAGIPLKAFETFSYGLPAVVTPLIASQLEINEDVALIGGNPQIFAEKVIQCYTEEKVWSNLRESGLHYVKEKGSKDLLKKELMQLKGWGNK